jgi:hypothetical protein
MVFKALLKQEKSFYGEIEGIIGNYDFVYILSKKREITVSSDSIVIIDSVSATNKDCIGHISEDVLRLIQVLLDSRRLVLLMQNLYVNDARYPDSDLHREVRLYSLNFIDHGEPTYIRISNNTVYAHLAYPAIM